jgi:hypothetical protein
MSGEIAVLVAGLAAAGLFAGFAGGLFGIDKIPFAVLLENTQLFAITRLL